MDRNIVHALELAGPVLSLSARRAWIEITVVGVLATLVTASLSARRAWIEIRILALGGLGGASLSARRAWIEMGLVLRVKYAPSLSLSARRAWIEIVITAMTSQISVCRSPQGERG